MGHCEFCSNGCKRCEGKQDLPEPEQVTPPPVDGTDPPPPPPPVDPPPAS